MVRVKTKKKVTFSISIVLLERIKIIGNKSHQSSSQLVEAALKHYYSDPLKAAMDERQKLINRIDELNPYIEKLKKTIIEKNIQESDLE